MADDSGLCSEANSAHFEVTVPAVAGGDNACARHMTSLENECSDALGWMRWSTNLHVGTTGAVTPSSTFSGDDYIQVRNNGKA